METRDLTHTEQPTATSTPFPHTAVPVAGMPYEGLRQIWDLFPGSHPNIAPASYSPTPAPAATSLVSSEAAYMARVHDLVRREEAALQICGAVSDHASAPAPVERPSMVWVPGPTGDFIAVPRHSLPAAYLQPALLPAAAPRDLTPEPLIDRRAQILAAGGLLAAGVGYGIGQVLNGLAGLSGGVLLGIAALVVAVRMPISRSTRGGSTYITHNHNRWFGKSTTTNR